MAVYLANEIPTIVNYIHTTTAHGDRFDTVDFWMWFIIKGSLLVPMVYIALY